MKMVIYGTVEEFLYECEEVLLQHEAANQLILSNAYRFKEKLETSQVFGCIKEKNHIELMFFNAFPFNLLITQPVFKKTVLDLLIDYLVDYHIIINGINASGEISRYFSEQYTKKTARPFYLHYANDIMELTKLNEIDELQNGLEKVSMDDFAEVSILFRGFVQEVSAIGYDEAKMWDSLKTRILNHTQYLFRNSFGHIVAIAHTTRPLKYGISISGVYTAPSYRGKGYAVQMIHAICKEQLQNGKTNCSLFVEKKNPISNHVYVKVGFKVIRDDYDYRLIQV